MACKPHALFFTILFSICSMGVTSTWANPLKVFVSITPQKYFIEQIGKEHVEVHVMVPPGASPATYEPKPRQMAALSKADAYFSIGVPFERVWLPKLAATNIAMQVIATDQGIKKLPITSHLHDQRHDSHHDREDTVDLDPHIWTSPPLVLLQARTILTALQTLDPSRAAVYAANHKVFAKTLDTLDRDLHTIFDHRQGAHFMVFHPSWGYFAHAYGLVQIPVELEGKAPKPAQLNRLITHAKSKNIKIIFVQPQFSAKSAALIANAIDGTIIAADPLALDWEANLRRQATQFNEALR